MRVLKNYLYNLSYQLLIIVLPVITTPYITRVFSSSALGSYGYYNSIVTYFILLATLGVANYGTKEISGHRKEVQKTFWGIYSLQVLATCLALVLYIAVCLIIPSMNNLIAYILGFSLLSRGLDISWLFQGMEDFKKITVRNTAVKLLGVASIFIFVKKPSDLYLYIVLLVGYDLLGQLSMWLPAREHIGRPHLDIVYAKQHIKPVILLFLPQIAISLYITLDRTMLGALSSTTDVGIYDQALKFLNILLTIVTSLGSVMLPRVSNLLSSGNQKAVNKLHEMSFLVYNLVIFPMVAGILIVNKDFVNFFLGKDFQDARYAIAIMVFRMFFIGWTNIMGIQILIPHNKNREFMLSTTIPAFFSVGLNILKEIKILPSMLKILAASLVMYGILYVIQPLIHFPSVVNVLISALLGLLIYAGLVLALRVLNVQELKSVFKK